MIPLSLAQQTGVAREIARAAHRGQYRRGGRSYYSGHVARVAQAVRRAAQNAGYSSETVHRLVQLAYLHDVVEDTPILAGKLAQLMELGMVDAWVMDSLLTLTKMGGEKYREYIARVKADPRARFVKIRDIEHNLSDNPTPRQVRRYRWALKELAE